jgi:DNA-binding response OmpR family regulator
MRQSDNCVSNRDAELRKGDVPLLNIPPETGGSQHQSASKPIRVLIADPDEMLLAEYRQYAHDQFDVVTALNGVECIKQIRQQKPDVLILEPRLHWGCGEGVLTMMHEVMDMATVPVMLLTSCNDSVLNLVTRFPISDYHPKPLSAGLLMDRIHVILSRQKARNNVAERSQRVESRLGSLVEQQLTVRGPRASFATDRS